MRKRIILCFLLFIFIITGCNNNTNNTKVSTMETVTNFSKATFAGGCFWCSEAQFEKINGVKEVISGYAGGEEINPTYAQVSSGKTGYREAVLVYYNPNEVSYEELLEVYWKHIDPTDSGGSFVDRGFQYTSAIFYHNENQKLLAEKSKAYIEDNKIFNDSIVTEILPYTTFYFAEEYHQDYYKKNPLRYKYYRGASGRDDFISKNWKEVNLNLSESVKQYSKPDIDEIKKMLDEEQFYVTQKNGTERAFNNLYWNNTEEGIYVDIVSGEPLFSSTDKYKSGTGWPSFTKPISEEFIKTKKDYKLIIPRTEVRSYYGDSHLGHVFNDGPKPTGLRYCMNSAAMRFVPKEDMINEGYKEYLYLFN